MSLLLKLLIYSASGFMSTIHVTVLLVYYPVQQQTNIRSPCLRLVILRSMDFHNYYLMALFIPGAIEN